MHPSLARPFFLHKHSDHEIAFVFFSNNKTLENGCVTNNLLRFETIEVKKTKLEYALSLKNKLTYQNLFLSKDFNIFHNYVPKMREKILGILETEQFDVIYADYLMRPYIYNLNIKIPVVLDFPSPTLFWLHQLYLNETISIRKMQKLFQYSMFKLFEAPRFKRFDAGIYVTTIHKELSEPFTPKKKFIIPPGVDIDYFNPSGDDTNSNIIVFFGDMSYPFNVYSIRHFCKNVYPLIRKEIPDVTLYIVGRNPSHDVLGLASKDHSISVTGEVADIRPYVNQAQVVILPFIISDGGLKTKALEAMAMGKAIVSTSIGMQGIKSCTDEVIVTADSEKSFAEAVINLLCDCHRRKRLGDNARKFVEEHYSWKTLTTILNKAFESV